MSRLLRGCVTAGRLLGCFNGSTPFLCFLRGHDRLDLAEHLIFLAGYMCLDERVQFLELRYPLLVIHRRSLERFDLAMRVSGVMCLVACGLRFLKDSIDMQVFYRRSARVLF